MIYKTGNNLYLHQNKFAKNVTKSLFESRVFDFDGIKFLSFSFRFENNKINRFYLFENRFCPTAKTRTKSTDFQFRTEK